MAENGNHGSKGPLIRVLVADDSIVVRSALARMLKDSPHIQLCGFATNGVEAVAKAKLLAPDVITLDVLMPNLDGIGALRQIMLERPCPVIMVSSLARHGADVTVEALSAGAFDYILKEDLFHASSTAGGQHLLIDRVEAAAQSFLYSNRARLPATPNLAPRVQNRPRFGHEGAKPPEIIAIGASTGGPKALETILTSLPADLPVPVVVVQHMPVGFTKALAERFGVVCEVRVHEARQSERLQPGYVYIAPAGQHMTVCVDGARGTSICLSDLPEDTLHKPSADVLMLSIAKAFGDRSMGVILTGMGSDGLQGMGAIHHAGGITIGQDAATSAIYGMPKVCAEHGVLQMILPVDTIAEHLLAEFRAAAHA